MSYPRIKEKKSTASKYIIKEFENKMMDIYCPTFGNTYIGYKKELFQKQKELSDEIEKLKKDKNENQYTKLMLADLAFRLKNLNLPTSFEDYIKADFISADGQVRATGFSRLSREDMTLKQTFTADFLKLNHKDQETTLKEAIQTIQLNNKNADNSGSTVNATLTWTTPTKEGRHLHIRNVNLGSNTYLVVHDAKKIITEKCLRISDLHQLPAEHPFKKSRFICGVSHAIGLTTFETNGIKHTPKITSLSIPLANEEKAILIETSNSFFESIRSNSDPSETDEDFFDSLDPSDSSEHFAKSIQLDSNVPKTSNRFHHSKRFNSAIDSKQTQKLKALEIEEMSKCIFAHQNASSIELGYQLLKYAFNGNKYGSSTGNVSIVPLVINEECDRVPQLTLIAEGQGPDGGHVSKNIADEFPKRLEDAIYQKLPLHNQIKSLNTLCMQSLNETMQHILKNIKDHDTDAEARYSHIIKYLNNLPIKNNHHIIQFKKTNSEATLREQTELQFFLENKMREHLKKIISRSDCSKQLEFLLSKYVYLNQLTNNLSIYASYIDQITSFRNTFKCLMDLETKEQKRRSCFPCNLFGYALPKDSLTLKMSTILNKPQKHDYSPPHTKIQPR